MAFCSFPSGADNFTSHQRIMHRLSLGRGTAIIRVDVLPPDHGDGWQRAVVLPCGAWQKCIERMDHDWPWQE